MIAKLRSQAAASDRANYGQADYFRDELHRQINLVSQRVVKGQAELAASTRHYRTERVRHLQGELRNCAVERRNLLEMLAALTRRFPDNEGALAR